MRDFLLALVMLACAGFGFWLMKRLDRFLETRVSDEDDGGEEQDSY
ncbi:MAG: hypothetical protein ACI4MF_02245 [Candidatus Faecivicinus sp.]